MRLSIRAAYHSEADPLRCNILPADDAQSRSYDSSRVKFNETDLRVELVSGGTIRLRGADNFDSLRGSGLDFLVLGGEVAAFGPNLSP